MKYVTWQGRRIAVETLDTGVPPTKVRRRQPDTFAAVRLQWAAKASIATNTGKAMVWVWLTYKAWQTKHSTFVVPNSGGLAEYGITSKVKLAALRQLEAAGLIAVKWRSRKSPIVTLLNPVGHKT
jgi:hypothetical protein